MSSSIALINFLKNSVIEGIEVKRISLCLLALRVTSFSLKGALFKPIANHIDIHKYRDGGWSDVEETMLSIKALSLIDHSRYNQSEEKGKAWLRSQQNPNGGWGRTSRDMSRIPITGLLIHLLPELSDSKAVSWLTNEWEKDLASDTKLTYKGGFFLMGLSASDVSANDCPLIEETYAYLFEERNGDGGFGPWKNHPIGSDPWSTGIVLLGLLSYPKLVKREVIEKTVNWLAEIQLPNGLWPCHYIEEGSAYAYWGLVEALKYLSKDIG